MVCLPHSTRNKFNEKGITCICDEPEERCDGDNAACRVHCEYFGGSVGVVIAHVA
jgi:hypothetical protein